MKLLSFFLLATAGVAFAAWTYRRRELGVPGRWVPATLRASALVLVVLLLFDFRLPEDGGGAERWVLVDRSASMAVGSDGRSPWDSARAHVEVLRAEGARVLGFGRMPVPLSVDDSLDATADETRSRLAPALEHAAEAGAREVVVVSDLRLEDPVAARAAFQRLSLGASFIDVGQEVRNAGVAALELPTDLVRDAPVLGEVTVFASGTQSGDSISLEIREEGRTVWSGAVEPPGVGRMARVSVTLPFPTTSADGGEVRYRASIVMNGDRFAEDDQVMAYASVDAREGAMIGVSFSPDWEFGHLLPALARVTGLPTRGFVRAGDRFLPTGGSEREPALSEREVIERLADARVVVLHGLGSDAPAWARDAAGSAPRALVFARDPTGALAAGTRAGEPMEGEWYVDADAPASALTGALVGLPFPAFPPLFEVLPAESTDGVSVLDARLRGTGPAEPVIVLRERGRGRVAVSLASGWWRWALRPGPAREAYGRVWSSVVGWLLAADSAGSNRVRPIDRVAEVGVPIAWTGSSAAPIDITVFEGERVVTDTTLSDPVPNVRTPPLPAGPYRYVTRDGADTTVGRFDVQGPVAELRHVRAQMPDSIATPPDAGQGASGRPLRAYVVPWLVLIGLLCGEWVARRRKGLR